MAHEPIERRPGDPYPWLKSWRRTADKLRQHGPAVYGTYGLLEQEANLYEWDDDGIGWLLRPDGSPHDASSLAKLCGTTVKQIDRSLAILETERLITIRRDRDSAIGLVDFDIDQSVYSETPDAARKRRYRSRQKAAIEARARDELDRFRRDMSGTTSGTCPTGERDSGRDMSRTCPGQNAEKRDSGRDNSQDASAQRSEEKISDQISQSETETERLEREQRAFFEKVRDLAEDVERLGLAPVSSAQVADAPRAAPGGK